MSFQFHSRDNESFVLTRSWVLLFLKECLFIEPYSLSQAPCHIKTDKTNKVLYLICFGCILMSSQIFFLFRYDVFGVNDDGETRNQKLLDATCVADMWFTNIGAILIYMVCCYATYSKASFQGGTVLS